MARTLRARHPPMFLPDLCGSIVTFGGVQGLQRPSWMGAPAEALGEKTFVSGDDYVCDICARGVLEENVERWWQHERQSSHSLLDQMRHFHISGEHLMMFHLDSLPGSLSCSSIHRQSRQLLLPFTHPGHPPRMSLFVLGLWTGFERVSKRVSP